MSDTLNSNFSPCIDVNALSNNSSLLTYMKGEDITVLSVSTGAEPLPFQTFFFVSCSASESLLVC